MGARGGSGWRLSLTEGPLKSETEKGLASRAPLPQAGCPGWVTGLAGGGAQTPLNCARHWLTRPIQRLTPTGHFTASWPFVLLPSVQPASPGLSSLLPLQLPLPIRGGGL